MPASGKLTPGEPPATPRAADPGAPSKGATLSRELSDFLVELSIAMQKHAIYPAGHPLLNAAIDGVMNKLTLLLADRSAISVGIARRQLIIEGVGTDPAHPLLKELAGRLHKHNLGAIRITQGFSRAELGDALATIAVDPGAGRVEKPLGDIAAELSSRWMHIRLYALDYERLQLLYEGADVPYEPPIAREGATRAAQLWIGMARAAMMLGDKAEMDDKKLSPLVVAEAIEKRPQEQAYDQVIVGYMLQIADELKRQGGTPETHDLQRRISTLVKQLSPASLRKLMQMGGDTSQRRQFLLNASQGMTVEAVMDLVNAASGEEGGRQTISHSMMRLFSKLATYAESDPDQARRANAETSVREHMSKLVSEWNLDDPNPTGYGKVLQNLSRHGGGSPPASSQHTDVEPERILQMAFELNAAGPRFYASLDALLNSARFESLLNLLDAAPDADFAQSAWSYLDSRDILWAALGEARIDFHVLERLVKRKRLSAVDPVLDVLERSDPRVRERLFEVLHTLGDDAGPPVARRIESARAELRRDYFLFLGKLGQVPGELDVSRYLVHAEPVVRREAVRLLLKFVETREHAIVAGVSDTDERAVFYALTAAQEGGCPSRAVGIVRQRIESGDLDSSLMTLAIRVLAAADSVTTPVLAGRGRTSGMLRALDIKSSATDAVAVNKTLAWLIGKVATRSRFLRRWHLQPKSPEMLASLGALSAYWNTEPVVQEILQLAVRAGDPDLRKAMGSSRVTGRFTPIRN